MRRLVRHAPRRSICRRSRCQRDDIAPVVEAALIRHDLTRPLVLELTESAIVTIPTYRGIMHALKSLGCTLAMDDFGTGYSNLAYLQKLPIDILKIDRSFVTGMLTDRDKIAIVRAVLSLAQALGMRTTAEGIESNDLAQTLAALGCTYGQGYLYARPLEAVDALSTIRRRGRPRPPHRRSDRRDPLGEKPSAIQRVSMARKTAATCGPFDSPRATNAPPPIGKAGGVHSCNADTSSPASSRRSIALAMPTR